MTDLHATAAALICNVHDGYVFSAPMMLRRLKHSELLDLAIILARQAAPDEPLRRAVTPRADADRSIAIAIAKAAGHYGVLPTDIMSTSREKRVAQARHVALWLAREAGVTYPKIGQAVQRDHSTVIASCRRVEGDHALLSIARAIRDESREVA